MREPIKSKSAMKTQIANRQFCFRHEKVSNDTTKQLYTTKIIDQLGQVGYMFTLCI